VYPCYTGNPDDEIDDKAGIVFLGKSQGYSKLELHDALREGDIADPHGFLETLRQELANLPSEISILTFLARMSLKDAIALNELIKAHSDKNVVIDKKAETGLYDPWSGGGSVLEIELEKDVVLPIKYIRSAMPDGYDGYYSIEKTYGVVRSIWRADVVKEIPATND
jgi:hypothetical protein